MKSNILPKQSIQGFFSREFFSGADPQGLSDSDAEENSGDEDDEDDPDSDNEDNSGDEGDGNEDEDNEEEDPYVGLKAALKTERKHHRTERQARIRAERERDEANQKLTSGTEKESEAINTLQGQLRTERDKNVALSKRIADQALHTAILQAATAQKFIDPEDALAVASSLEVDQDPDDPTSVEVDKALVLSEIKALAKRKPHLVGKAKTTTTSRSGTRQSGNRQRAPKKGKANLAEIYPSLG